jgi:hypothetical protein
VKNAAGEKEALDALNKELEMLRDFEFSPELKKELASVDEHIDSIRDHATALLELLMPRVDSLLKATLGEDKVDAELVTLGYHLGFFLESFRAMAELCNAGNKHAQDFYDIVGLLEARSKVRELRAKKK